jgi:hypothetical protein
MQKTQESKIKMSRAVSGILTAYEDVVLRIPGLNAAHIALENLIAETERHSKNQLNKGTGLTALKDDSRGLLENEVIHIGAAVVAQAKASNDPAYLLLKEKYKVTDTEIKKKRDMTLFTYAYSLYDDAISYVPQIEPFATADEINQLKVTADNFNELLPKRRTQVSQSALATANLDDAVTQIDLLLEETIDVLVKPFETKESDFYKAYKNARFKVVAASHKETKPDEIPPVVR